LPVVVPRFISLPTSGNVKHPDFEQYSGNAQTLGMVKATLGADGKPVYTGICQTGAIIGPCPYGAQTTSAAAFAQWYNDTAGVT